MLALVIYHPRRIQQIWQQEGLLFMKLNSQNFGGMALRGFSMLNVANWPGWNLSDISSDDLERLSQPKYGSEVFFESANVVQENSDQVSMSVCTIDERKYSSLRKLLRVIVFCLKFIKKRVCNKCSDEMKKRICNRHRILNISDDLRDHGIYSQDIRSARLIWVYIVQRR